MTPPNDSITLRFLASPQDTGADGTTVAPGRILEWIDKAGYACAVGWAAAYCVTAYVGNVRFDRRIAAGELIEIHARIVHTGRTSMQVLVSAGTADVQKREFSAALSCILVFVAVDDSRSPVPVRPWSPRSMSDCEMHDRAAARVRVRREIRAAMLAQRYTASGTAPRTTFRFLASPADANWRGNAHGGTVMRWIGEAAHTTAAGWLPGRPELVYSGGMHFLHPIAIGDIVELEARLIHTADTQAHVAVQVWSASPRRPRERTLTTVCMSIFEERDAHGSARPVPALALQSDEDRLLDAHARDLIAMRAALMPLPL